MKELINIHILELLFNLHTDESKILTLVITNGRRDMLTRKVFSEKFIFYLNEKNIYDKNISYWIQIYFYWAKIYILISWEKGGIMRIYFIEYKFVLIEWKYILISWKKVI